jgi:hypothetical protein
MAQIMGMVWRPQLAPRSGAAQPASSHNRAVLMASASIPPSASGNIIV